MSDPFHMKANNFWAFVQLKGTLLAPMQTLLSGSWQTTDKMSGSWQMKYR